METARGLLNTDTVWSPKVVAVSWRPSGEGGDDYDVDDIKRKTRRNKEDDDDVKISSVILVRIYGLYIYAYPISN